MVKSRSMISRRSSRGAAMVELIVIAVFVLVPLYLSVQAIGKLGDVQNTANMAARYAAWEKTVWHEDTVSKFNSANAANQKSTIAIHNEILTRVVNDGRANLKYQQSDKTQTTFVSGTSRLWEDTSGKAFLSDAAKMTLTSVYETPSKDFTGKSIALIDKIPVPQIVGTLAPPVPVNTLAVSTISLSKIADTSPVYKRLWSKSAGVVSDWIGLDYSATSGILSNTWAANASSGTKAMVASSVPTANALGTFVAVPAIASMVAWDLLEAPRLNMGRIAPDVVPPDRLK